MNAQFSRLAKVVIGVAIVAISSGATVASGHPQQIAADESPVGVRAVVTQVLPNASALNSVVLQPIAGVKTPLHVILESTTRYFDHGVAVTSSALVLGLVINVEVTGSPAIATSVHILSHDPVFVDGTVSSVAPATGVANSLVVQPRNLKMSKVMVNLADATLYYAGGIASTVSTLSVGDQVHLVAIGNPLIATLVDFEGSKPISVLGTVSSLSSTSLTVLPQNPRAIAVAIALGTATIFKEGAKTVEDTNLVMGSHVQILASGSPETALLVDISPPVPVHFNGIVVRLRPSVGIVKTLIVQPDGFFNFAREFYLSRHSVYRSGDVRQPLAELQVGAHVRVSASGDPLRVTTIVSLDLGTRKLVGKVIALKGDTLTLQPRAAGAIPVTLKLNTATLYYSKRQSAAEIAVRVGELVRVTTSGSTSAVAADVEVLRARFVGRVIGLSGDSIVLKNVKNDLVTVHVTDSTHILLFASPAHINDVVLGARVEVAGNSTSNSVAIDASTLVISSRDIPLVRTELMEERTLVV